MHVLITARHVDLTAEQKSHAEEKLSRLTKYYDLVQEIECVVESAEHGKYHVEVIVTAEHHNRFVANCTCEKPEACIDSCFLKLERQMTEHKNKHRNRKHPAGGAEATIRHSAV